jgi:hypothetical protein
MNNKNTINEIKREGRIGRGRRIIRSVRIKRNKEWT